MSLKILPIIGLLITPLSLNGQEELNLKGKAHYEMNCAACHLLNIRAVGPSLVKIAETYPSGQTNAFIQWAKNPGKKDPNMIQMPSMAHISEEALAGIHHYILQITPGKTEQRKRHHFPPFKEPKRELPYVVRAFLPQASPASIAVILKENISLCWDTEACRFRYAWPGSATKITGSREPANLPQPFYQENAETLWSFSSKIKPQFLGYRLAEKYPIFNYIFGEIEIREKISNGATAGSIVREFTLSGVKKPVSLNLSHLGDVSILSSKGVLQGNTLNLTAKQAKFFSLTISPK